MRLVLDHNQEMNAWTRIKSLQLVLNDSYITFVILHIEPSFSTNPDHHVARSLKVESLKV